MKAKLLGILVLVTLISACYSADDAGEVGFPGLKGWNLEISPDVYTPENLWDLINGAAESYLSYDFIDLHLADYQNKKGSLIHAEVYRHSSPENAFGIYSSERSPEYNFLDIGIQGYLDEGVLNYFTGRYYVKLYSTGSGKDVQEGLKQVGKAVSDHLGQRNEWPGLLEAFPADGKLPNRDHYVRENFIGLNFLHSAFTAEYEGGYKLFAIRGEDREDILDMVRSYLEFTGQDIDPEAESAFTVTDRYNGAIPVLLSGPYLTGILNGPESEEARQKLQLLVDNLKEQ